MNNKTLSTIGYIAFIIGLVIAVLVGLLAAFGVMDISGTAVIIILLILGIIIGFINVNGKDMIPLLLATIGLIVVGGVFSPFRIMQIGSILDNILQLLATLMAPAVVIVAVKIIISVGSARRINIDN